MSFRVVARAGSLLDGERCMKASDFRYERPQSLEEALALLHDNGDEAVPVAGGQSLMPMMNFRMAEPELLVDLNEIEVLKGIRLEGENIVIGAMTRYAELDASQEVAQHIPLMAKALPHIAHAAIRNRGTIGGSVSLADPAAEMPALLMALDARIRVQSRSGEKSFSADDFFLGIYETALEEGELVTEILIPKARPDQRFTFYELARRHGDYAMSGVALAVRGDADIESCRIAFFAVCDRAVRATGAEAALTGGRSDNAENIDRAVASLSEMEFMGDLNARPEIKKHLSGVVLRRALAEL